MVPSSLREIVNDAEGGMYLDLKEQKIKVSLKIYCLTSEKQLTCFYAPRAKVLVSQLRNFAALQSFKKIHVTLHNLQNTLTCCLNSTVIIIIKRGLITRCKPASEGFGGGGFRVRAVLSKRTFHTMQEGSHWSHVATGHLKSV